VRERMVQRDTIKGRETGRQVLSLSNQDTRPESSEVGVMCRVQARLDWKRSTKINIMT